MAQLIVRNLEDVVRDRLRARAAAHGRSMEEEVREILRAAVRPRAPRKSVGLGSCMARRFSGIGLREGEVSELRSGAPRAAALDE